MNPLTVYKASAGSGKTFTLAVEYIKLLLLSTEGNEYSHILAVTFTNKATTEMKDRIISQLFGIAHGLQSSQSYLNALRDALRGEPDAPATDDEIRVRCGKALHKILHDYSRFRVGTIDSFFQTILRGLAHELGLTANLQVEINDVEVLSQAVDRIVDHLQDEPLVLDWFYSLVRDQIENNQRWDVTRRVKDFGRAIFNEDYLRRGEKLRTVLKDQQFMNNFIRELRDQEANAISIVKSWGKQIEESCSEAGITYSEFSNGQRILGGLVARLKAGELSDIEISTTIQRWADDPLTMIKKADQNGRPDLMDAADAVSSVLNEMVAKLPDLQYAVNSSRQALAHIKPLLLLDYIDREVAEINAETSRFNLAKTPILLARMIGESDAPFVFEKIGALLHHVMIDEFQDTSRLQWENFRSLLLESYSRGGRNLLVGDVKQSIYRWRGGDWRTLGSIEKNVVPPPVVRTLDTNFRSQRRIIDFNNDFFHYSINLLEAVSQSEEQMLSQPNFFRKAYADVHQEVPGYRSRDGYIRVRVLSYDDYHSRDEWQPVVLEDLCQNIRELHEGGMPYEQMAILVRNNFECEAIVQAFAAVDDMPPIVSDEAFLLSSCLPVTLLVEALRFLSDSRNLLSRYYLSEHQVDVELLEQQRDTLLLMPLYELLERLYLQLNLSRYAGQDAFIFGFFDAVTDYLRGESADIVSFLTFWDENLSKQSIPAGEVNGIRILTIHKAKGLEFQTVLMPFCTWDFERDRSTSLMWCTPQQEPYSELQLLPVTPSAKITPNSIFAQDYAETHLLSRMDELNTLYVGFTRARANLLIWCVGGDMERDSRTVGDLVACVVPEILGGGTNGIYTAGVPLIKEAESEQEENRMELKPEPLQVVMKSYEMGVTFRQSNQSAQFVAAQSDSAEDSAEDATQQHYLEMGRLLHRVLQNIRVEEDVEDILTDFERQGLISKTTADGTMVAIPRTSVERWVRQGLRNPLVNGWFKSQWKLFNECSIISLDDNHLPSVHRPDRVMISPDGRRIVVVDFKFGTMHPEYETQVRGYINLLSQMSPNAQVEGYLWFVYTGKVLRVSDGKKSENTGSSSRKADDAQLTLDF